MSTEQPEIQTMNASAVRQQFRAVINRVFRKELRVVVEKNGIPVAALVSVDDLRRLEELDAQRADALAVLAALRAPFRGVSSEEIEPEAAKALAEARAERFAALDATQAAFAGVPDEELARVVEQTVRAIRHAQSVRPWQDEPSARSA